MIEDTSTLQDVYMRRHTKSETIVWESIEGVAEATIMEIVKRRWFFLPTINVAQRTFDVIWAKAVSKYPFLRGTEHETAEVLDMDHMSLYLFLSGLDKKDRVVRMQDSSARSHSVVDTITRVFWPHTKVISALTSDNREVECLRHYLYSLSTFFFNSKLKNAYVKDALETSDVLAQETSSLPNKARRLKIIRDFLVNRSKESAYLSICMLKTGAFGYFTQRQDNIMNVEGKRAYVGHGEWLGEVCNVPVKIILDGEHVSKIIIQKLTDVINLSHGIKNIIEEHRSKFPLSTNKSNQRLYLDDAGFFRISLKVPDNSVCVEIDDLLETTNLETVYDMDWDVSLVAGRLRLTVSDPTENDEVRPSLLTVLSDSLVYSDWDPSLFTTIETRDPLFNKWVLAKPATIKELESSFEVAYDYRAADMYIKNNSERYTFGVGNRYNKEGFFTCLQAHYRWARDDIRRGLERSLAERVNRLGKTREEASSSKQINLADLVIKDVSRLLEKINKTSEEIAFDTVDMGQFSIEKLLPDKIEDIDMIAPDEELLKQMEKMFLETDDEALQAKIDREMQVHMMPVSNDFFKSIDLLAESSEQEEELFRLLSWDKARGQPAISLNGMLGFLMSLVTGWRVFSTKAVMGESEMKELTDLESAYSGKEVFKIGDLPQLELELDQLRDLYDKAQGRFKDQISLTLQRKTLEVQCLKDSLSGDSKDIVQIPYEAFLNALLHQASELGLWDKSYLASGDKVNTLFIGDCLERVHLLKRISMITQNEVAEITGIIWSKIVSKELIRAAAHCLQADISISLDGVQLTLEKGIMSTCHVHLHFIS